MNKENLNIFIIGPSGCGKSTQAKLVSEKYSLTHYSMGQLLRDEIAANSVHGQTAQSFIDQGKWVPDDLAFDILTSALEKINNNNFVIDGFPRMLKQGIIIENYLQTKNSRVNLIIHLDVTAQEISDRRAKVAQIGGKFQEARSDEHPEAITARQKSYDESITPIFEHYKNDPRFIHIDGNRPIEPIFNDICAAVENQNK